jgi:hypothetical protein
MHIYRNNQGRFVSSKDLKRNPHTNSTEIGVGKTPPGGSSREASEAPEEEPRTKESTLGNIEHESTEGTESLEDTQNLVSEPYINGGKIPSEMEEEEGNENAATETETFGFPILNISRNISMKNIPLSSLPTFRGMSIEDPDLFLFEFNILCRTYNCSDDAQKLKLFLATLKDSALRWFMSLGENTFLSWE